MNEHRCRIQLQSFKNQYDPSHDEPLALPHLIRQISLYLLEKRYNRYQTESFFYILTDCYRQKDKDIRHLIPKEVILLMNRTCLNDRKIIGLDSTRLLIDILLHHIVDIPHHKSILFRLTPYQKIIFLFLVIKNIEVQITIMSSSINVDNQSIYTIFISIFRDRLTPDEVHMMISIFFSYIDVLYNLRQMNSITSHQWTTILCSFIVPIEIFGKKYKCEKQIWNRLINHPSVNMHISDLLQELDDQKILLTRFMTYNQNSQEMDELRFYDGIGDIWQHLINVLFREMNHLDDADLINLSRNMMIYYPEIKFDDLKNDEILESYLKNIFFEDGRPSSYWLNRLQQTSPPRLHVFGNDEKTIFLSVLNIQHHFRRLAYIKIIRKYEALLEQRRNRPIFAQSLRNNKTIRKYLRKLSQESRKKINQSLFSFPQKEISYDKIIAHVMEKINKDHSIIDQGAKDRAQEIDKEIIDIYQELIQGTQLPSIFNYEQMNRQHLADSPQIRRYMNDGHACPLLGLLMKNFDNIAAIRFSGDVSKLKRYTGRVIHKYLKDLPDDARRKQAMAIFKRLQMGRKRSGPSAAADQTSSKKKSRHE